MTSSRVSGSDQICHFPFLPFPPFFSCSTYKYFLPRRKIISSMYRCTISAFSWSIPRIWAPRCMHSRADNLLVMCATQSSVDWKASSGLRSGECKSSLRKENDDREQYEWEEREKDETGGKRRRYLRADGKDSAPSADRPNSRSATWGRRS